MSADYEYTGMVAQAWDLLRGDTSGWPDRAFYRALIERQGGGALDVGCGTGRLLLDYREAGLDIDGVDNSPEMLAICRAKAAREGIDLTDRVFQGEMDTLALPRLYRTILVPSSTFQLLTDPAAAASALGRFHDHLEPGGLLVMSMMSKLWRGKRAPPQMEWLDWSVLAQRERPEDGAVVRRWIRTRYDHDAQLEHEENRYELLRDGVLTHSEAHQRSPAVRWYSQAQIIERCEAARFVDVRLTSGFTFEPAAPEDTLFCVLARRA